MHSSKVRANSPEMGVSPSSTHQKPDVITHPPVQMSVSTDATPPEAVALAVAFLRRDALGAADIAEANAANLSSTLAQAMALCEAQASGFDAEGPLHSGDWAQTWDNTGGDLATASRLVAQPHDLRTRFATVFEATK